MHTFEFTQNNLKGTILLNALDAKKHFIINTQFQTLGLSANAVEKKELKTQIAALKKAKELYLNIDEFYQLAFDIIDNARKDEILRVLVITLIIATVKNLKPL